MSQNHSASLKELLRQEYHFTDYQFRQIRYLIISFLSEITKLTVMSLFFSYFGKLGAYFFSVCILLSIRSFTGGIHLKHYLTCLLFSFLFFFTAVILLPALIHLSVLSMMIVLVGCILLVYKIGPIPSATRPPLDLTQKKKASMRAVTSILIYVYLLFIFQDHNFLVCGFWCIVLQSLQLGVANIIKKGA